MDGVKSNKNGRYIVMKRFFCGIVLMVGLLLSVPCLFAADGDLTVNGSLIAPGVVAQALTVTGTTDATTTSTSFVDMPGMIITLTTTGNSKLLILWNAGISMSSASYYAMTEANVDGVRAGAPQGGGTATTVQSVAGQAVASVAAGSHTIKVRWKVSAGTASNKPVTSPDRYGRTLTVLVIRQ
jgi:hypothetical protein